MSKFAKRVYRFGSDVVDGDGSMREILGGKGAGLAEMTMLSVPVPPGFTISTDACRSYLQDGALPTELSKEIAQSLTWLEQDAGKRFGDPKNPLLVSVRSGAPVSMPGMMDTILNVGLNDESVQGLTAKSESRRFAFDSYMRLLQMFGSIVLDVPKAAFDQALKLSKKGDIYSEELTEKELCLAIEAFKKVILERTGIPFPQDPQQQLEMAIEAVFRSWESERARYYRSLNHIAEAMGTAVTVQTMVFGNLGRDSGTGVGFTRSPLTGTVGVFGEFLSNAQGEDIVAGVRTPVSISDLHARMPAVYDELMLLVSRLEQHYREVQDFEFTVECGKLFLLQTRAAKLSAQASVKVAVDMAGEGLITREEALGRVKTSNLIQTLSSQLDFSDGEPVMLASGLPASPGAAVGIIALCSNHALEMAKRGEPVILLTEETTANDIHGMAASAGLLTARGGATSHAAVVARGMGKCCITGAKDISFNDKAATVKIGGKIFREGDWLSLDGSTGHVFEGKLRMRPASEDHPELDRLLAWALESGNCLVRANADTPADAMLARAARASGIGLCRTEHMFFAADRLAHFREMILATNSTDRIKALDVLLPMQQQDFEELFRTMSPLPVTIRLLDPPLHEFLPSMAEINMEMTDARADENWEQCILLQKIRRRVQTLTESNPMMGHRGCRLSLTYPEILRMQVRAILRAALLVTDEGFETNPEIMVPLVSSEEEMRILAELIHTTAAEVFSLESRRIHYRIGTMIELPRAAVCAGPISKHVDFISFGTNDLTQMTFGFSRDDSRSYLDGYLESGILKADPFITIDREGVGNLMEMAIKSVRSQNLSIKIGVCGEHGGDPESIHFFQSLGVDYVSCSPARIPVAQLAIAQAGSSREFKLATQ